jgi:hypothetical protein
MQTPHKLYYRIGPIAAETFNADFDKLLGIVDGLIGFAPKPPSEPAVVLFFADAPEGTSVEDALIGPKFSKASKPHCSGSQSTSFLALATWRRCTGR